MHGQRTHNRVIWTLAVALAAGSGCASLRRPPPTAGTWKLPRQTQITYYSSWDQQQACPAIDRCRTLPANYSQGQDEPPAIAQAKLEITYPHPNGRADCGQARVTFLPVSEQTLPDGAASSEGEELQGETWTLDLPLRQVAELEEQSTAEAWQLARQMLGTIIFRRWMIDFDSFFYDPELDAIIAQVSQEGHREHQTFVDDGTKPERVALRRLPALD